VKCERSLEEKLRGKFPIHAWKPTFIGYARKKIP